MAKALYRAAIEGNVDFLREVRDREIETGCWNKHLLSSLTPQKNNIIHIATQYDQYDFLKKGFDTFNFSPLMIAGTNANGDTPLHLASKRGNIKIVRLLVEAFNEWVFREIEISNQFGGVSNEAAEGEEKMPWKVKNLEGNTPLHEALICGKIGVATYLVEVDPLLATFVNNNKETPLHLAIKYNVDDDKKLTIDTIELMNKKQASLAYKGLRLEEDSMAIIKQLLQTNEVAINEKDGDGQTPLLRAALQSHFRAIKMILDEHPECLETCDPMGKNVLHLLKFQSYKEAKNFFQNCPRILNLKDQQDNMGNTPAHIAVLNCIERISKECKLPQLRSLNDDEQSNEEHEVTSSTVVKKCMNNFTDDQMLKRERDIIGVVKAFFESSTNFSIKNKEGLSANTLFQQLKSRFSCIGLLPELDMEIKVVLAENKHKWVNEENLRKDVQTADVNYLREKMESCIQQGSLGITNLLYKLLKSFEIKHSDDDPPTMKCACCFNYNHKERHDQSPKTEATCCYHKVEGLIMELFEKNPWYIYETNSRGETPLHIMARVQEVEICGSLLNQIKRSYNQLDEAEVYCPPWRVKNMKGNTPIHEALLLHVSPKNEGIIKFLMECEPDVFQRHDEDEPECDRGIVGVYFNNQSETPLHVFCGCKEKVTDEKIIQEIIEANKWATMDRDVEGLTPLLRAATNGQIDIVKQFWEISPESALQLRDYQGRTFWHMMNMSETTHEQEVEVKRKAKEKQIILTLSSATDNNGNTPLLQAIKGHNYNLAQVLSKITKRSVNDVLTKESLGMRYTLFILNIASLLPGKLEKQLWNKMKNLGVKSAFGVPKSEISGYTNTIGVIAALLATIAFQGAFAVPGGYHQEKGYPVLLEHKNANQLLRPKDHMVQFIRIAAFWVFFVADILTMCLSMMVLFCLQWIITGDDREKFIITDLCLLLLNMAFMTTIIAFMMGVCASTYPIQHVLAIFTVVLCSAVMLLLQKWVIMSAIQYVFLTVYLFVTAIFRYIVSTEAATIALKKLRDFCNRIWYW